VTPRAPVLFSGSVFRLGPALIGAGLGLAGPAHASWLDTDFYCRVYGCVIAHDGFSFDVYDNYNFATGAAVPAGARMLRWTGNPVAGTGAVNPVFTGTRTEGFHAAPLQDESFRVGIDRGGDGIADILPTGTGFLDAGDAFNPFAITSTADLVAADSSAQRSFYLTSRTDFFLAARVFPVGTPDPLNTAERFSNISLTYRITPSGLDEGMDFGSNASNANGQMRVIGNVDDLGDLYAAPVNIMEFRRDIRQRESASLPSQSVRFDYVYGFRGYDLSLGAGHLRYRIEFDFVNR
jgi:hypothetical protein